MDNLKKTVLILDKSISDLQKLIIRNQKIMIKPLSLNYCFNWSMGTYVKNEKYKNYIENLKSKLIDIYIPKGKLKLSVDFGVSSKGSDIDNLLKPFIDVISERYGINDNRFLIFIIYNISYLSRFFST